jgi:glutamine amidotransferase
MITIINYGLGNLGSVQNMLKRIGAPCKISSDLKEIEEAEKILLPGVGAFDSAIQKIDELNLRSVLVHKAKVDKIPFHRIVYSNGKIWSDPKYNAWRAKLNKKEER